MARAQLQSAGVAENDLGVESIAEPQGAIDGRGVLIGRQRFIESIGGGQANRQRVIENGGLAMIMAGERDALCYGLPAGVDRTVEIPAGALHPCSNAQTLQPLFGILPRPT